MMAMGNDDLCRLLEWCGMYKHLRFDLKGAPECYEERCCSKLDPENSELFVKRVGVNMDGAKYSKEDALFKEALALNPTASDALRHRANLHMLQLRFLNLKLILRHEFVYTICLRGYLPQLYGKGRLGWSEIWKRTILIRQRLIAIVENCISQKKISMKQRLSTLQRSIRTAQGQGRTLHFSNLSHSPG
ncbi:hypothetical protein ACHAXM_004116 [Skeletonema potamos]|jgi:hypothetical protein